jgi:hypothetical protein
MEVNCQPLSVVAQFEMKSLVESLGLRLSKMVNRLSSILGIREHIKQSASDAVERLRVRSALNPILWLCVIVTAPGMAATPFFQNGAPIWFIVIVFLPVIIACFGFLVLLAFDRDKLQSEDYQLRKRSLELIQEKGQAVPISPASINIIANPNYPKMLE